jgi:hypothetical protein
MTETTSHHRAKTRAAGKGGETEVSLPGGGRLDALSANRRATEVERNKDPEALIEAVRRLRDADASQRVLKVPQPHMDAAAAAMRKVGVHGTVKNMSETKRRSV